MAIIEPAVPINQVLTMAYSVTLEKGKNNMIGISIGGGAPFCPVVYIVQVCEWSVITLFLVLNRV